MDIFFYLNSVLLGAGLAMDAFSVSAVRGLNEPEMSGGKMLGIAGVFGMFQAVMPLAGWFFVRTAAERLEQFGKFVPVIALVLLLLIGIKMIIEGARGEDVEKEKATGTSFGALITQGIATSIDALSVGFTIENIGFFPAFAEALIIGTVTFAICAAGVYIGKKIGTKLAGKASVVGGVILIIVGIEIFVKGFF